MQHGQAHNGKQAQQPSRWPALPVLAIVLPITHVKHCSNGQKSSSELLAASSRQIASGRHADPFHKWRLESRDHRVSANILMVFLKNHTDTLI